MFWCSGGYNEIDISQIYTKLTTLALMLTLYSRVSVAYFIICTMMLVKVKLNVICCQVILYILYFKLLYFTAETKMLFELFTVCTKLAEMAILYSKDLRSIHTMRQQQRLFCRNGAKVFILV